MEHSRQPDPLKEAECVVLCPSRILAEAMIDALGLTRGSLRLLPTEPSTPLHLHWPEDPPDLAMIIESAPGVVEAVVRMLRQRWPHIKIVVLSRSEDESVISGAYTAGADAVVLPGDSFDQLVRTTRQVLTNTLRRAGT